MKRNQYGTTRHEPYAAKADAAMTAFDGEPTDGAALPLGTIEKVRQTVIRAGESGTAGD